MGDQPEPTRAQKWACLSWLVLVPALIWGVVWFGVSEYKAQQAHDRWINLEGLGEMLLAVVVMVPGMLIATVFAVVGSARPDVHRREAKAALAGCLAAWLVLFAWVWWKDHAKSTPAPSVGPDNHSMRRDTL